jgi:ribosomal protein S18 acetylase RimI-like enzyme
MSNLIIRIASAGDAELIADLSRKTFLETFAGENTRANMDKFMDEQFTRERLIKEVGAAQNIFLIAELNGETIGYARLRESDNALANGLPSIEIARIYAVQSKIGKGVGSALMDKCIEVARQNNKVVVWLGVWEKNIRAISFYQRWGFEIFGEHEFILGDDVQKDLLMRKFL